MWGGGEEKKEEIKEGRERGKTEMGKEKREERNEKREKDQGKGGREKKGGEQAGRGCCRGAPGCGLRRRPWGRGTLTILSKDTLLGQVTSGLITHSSVVLTTAK